MEYFYIYKITDPNTGEYYIGRRKSYVIPEDDLKYKGSSKSWFKTLTIDYINNVLVKEILIKNIVSFDDLCLKEIELLKDNVKHPLCKNKHIPGIGFFMKGPHTKDHNNKIAIGNQGKTRNTEARRNMSTARRNSESVKKMFLSNEWRNKISTSMLSSDKLKK
jgi:hypothetical protein